MNTQPEAELWSNETIAEFHLNNALNEDGYRWAIQQVLSMGIDPTKLNPTNLDHSETWQRPELYTTQALAKHKS